MRKRTIIFDPKKTIKENAEINGVCESTISRYIKQNQIDKRGLNAAIKHTEINKIVEREGRKKATLKTGYHRNTIHKYIAQKDVNNCHEYVQKIKSVSASQTEILANIIRLYIGGGRVDCDLTYSVGKMWNDLQPPIYKFDKFPQSFDVRPLEDIETVTTGSYGSVIFDLPYIVKSSDADAETSYITRRFGHFTSDRELFDTNREMLTTAHRVLRRGGILIVKTQNTYSVSNHQLWVTYFVFNEAEKLGFVMLDEFVLTADKRIYHNKEGQTQHCARKFHSYFLVFKKLHN